MIGVDVIDRSCSFKGKSKHSFADYISKIVNNSELDFCDSWEDLDLIWAIKESAYKCYFKKDAQSFLNPKKIRITRIDKQDCRFQVEIDEYYFTGHFKLTKDFVYVISSDKDDFALNVELFFLDDYTDAVYIQPEFNQQGSRYMFHPLGFPQAIQQSEAIYAYSRSHHGKYYFSAISITPYN